MSKLFTQNLDKIYLYIMSHSCTQSPDGRTGVYMILYSVKHMVLNRQKKKYIMKNNYLHKTLSRILCSPRHPTKLKWVYCKPSLQKKSWISSSSTNKLDIQWIENESPSRASSDAPPTYNEPIWSQCNSICCHVTPPSCWRRTARPPTDAVLHRIFNIHNSYELYAPSFRQFFALSQDGAAAFPVVVPPGRQSAANNILFALGMTKVSNTRKGTEANNTIISCIWYRRFPKMAHFSTNVNIMSYNMQNITVLTTCIVFANIMYLTRVPLFWTSLQLHDIKVKPELFLAHSELLTYI